MERPKVGVGVCIIKKGKVLFGQRKNAHGDGTWSFPGGHLEFGESYEDCARRETLEEAGILIKNVQFVTATNDIFPEGKHYITIYMTAEYDSGDLVVKEPDKMVGWDWFNWEEIPSFLFLPIHNLLKTGFNPFSNRYEHYKGKHYEMLGEAVDVETKRKVVIYKGLYNDAELGKEPLFARPKEMFHSNVTVDGKEVKRFRRV